MARKYHRLNAAGLALAFLLAANASSARAGEVDVMTFSGLCDASAAVSLEAGFFAVADDEDNVLRIYHPQAGPMPMQSLDMSRFLRVDPREPEADFEGAARMGEKIFWITSHGRNTSGKVRSSRQRFFATTLSKTNGTVTLAPFGQPYDRLLDDLCSDPRLRRFNLAAAASKAPKTRGALNIEGLAATPDGKLWIGFRNPIPDGQALLVPLLNPAEIVSGGTAQLGDPVLLSLGGKGIRSITEWRGQFLLVAGAFDGGGRSDLYLWDGKAAAAELQQRLDYGRLNPEALAEIPAVTESDLLIVSDDGNVIVGKKPCKKLKDPRQKRFRAALVPSVSIGVAAR
jgi:hypothetical protein